MGDTLIVVKALKRDGRAPYQAGFTWPLPKPGQPGDWVEVDTTTRKPALCSWGLHGYLTLAIAKREHEDRTHVFFEMELEGDIVKDQQKAAGARARLIRVLAGTYQHTLTLGEIAAAVQKNGTHPSALAAAAANLGLKVPALEAALPDDAYVVDDLEQLVTVKKFLKGTPGSLGDGFTRRIWALGRLPVVVQVGA